MAILTLNEARNAATRSKVTASYRTKTAGQVLNERATEQASKSTSYHVFLSHSYQDAQVDEDAMLGVYNLLSDAGVSVYVDWIVDKELSRDSVTAHTAAVLKARMQQSASLFFVTSKTSDQSKWMPWELGYFDGHKGKVAILPLTGGAEYKGQEYLGLYPYVDKTSNTIYIHKDANSYMTFAEWIKK